MSPFTESGPEMELPPTLESFSETREVEDIRYLELADALAYRGLEIVEERFGTPEQPKDGQFYHNRDHSEAAIHRSELILREVKTEGREVTATEIALTKLIAAFHDTVQNYRQKTDWPEGSDDAKFGRIFRARSSGPNEQASIVELWQEMQRINQAEGKTVFTRQDAAIAEETIRGTVPAWDQARGTVTQPMMTAESSLVARVVTLADLGEAGMTTERFIVSGDRLFLEENIDMHGLDIVTLSDEAKAYYKKRMVGWLKAQIGFTKGRKAMLDQETIGLPETVRVLFDSFNRSIASYEAYAESAEKKSFEEVYRGMGF